MSKFKALLATNLPAEFIEDFKPASSPPLLQAHVGSASDVDLHFIISTGSGAGTAEDFFGQVLNPLTAILGLEEGRDFLVHRTRSEDSITELTRHILLPRANAGHAQSVVLLSGDGGMIDIVNEVHKGSRSNDFVQPSIVVLPFGTGNALANSNNCKDDTMGLSTLFKGKHTNLSSMRASLSTGARLVTNEGRDEQPLGAKEGVPEVFGAVVCSWGLHASLVGDSDTAEYRKFGAERFQMAAKALLSPEDGSEPHAYKGSVSFRAPGKDKWTAIDRTTHGYVLATLVSDLEKGFTISPASIRGSGKMMLIEIPPLATDEIMQVMMAAYDKGKHVGRQNVGYHEIDGLKIEFHEDDGRWRRVCIDGKIIKVEKGGSLLVEKVASDQTALHIVVGRPADGDRDHSSTSTVSGKVFTLR